MERRLAEEGSLDEVIADILEGKLNPYLAVDQLLERVKGAEI